MFNTLIEKRRSIRKYQDKAIEKEKMDRLVEAALRAPSSRSFNPWRFIIVRSRKLLNKLAKSKPHGSSFLKNAVLGIVVCGDPDKSDVWIEDCSIASTYIQLAAESMGLGSCWIQIRNRPHDKKISAEAYIADVLDIIPSLKVESIIAVGYPDEIKSPHEKEKLQYEKVYLDRYGQSYVG